MAGGIRIGVAFNQDTLEPSPTWTYLTDDDNLVAGYTKDVGRQFEFDKVDTGTASIIVNDAEGLLDFTNSSSAYTGHIQPLLQIKIELWNPVTSAYSTRFRGFIRDYNYNVQPWVYRDRHNDPKGVTSLQLDCVDMFEILTAIEMQRGSFGDDPGASGFPDVWFSGKSAHLRALQVFGDAGIDSSWFHIFTLNVDMQPSTYSPSTPALQPLEDVADAEFPTLGNVYVDRLGKVAIHGRGAKFDPDNVAADAGSAWAYNHWKCGDEEAVLASIADTAQIREFAYNLGLSKVFNSAFCTPFNITPANVAGQYWKDDTSIGIFGFRSWSAENLLIDTGTTTGNIGRDECLLYAKFIVANYKDPHPRFTGLNFKSMNPDDDRAAATWKLLCECDIADAIDTTIKLPGSQGFNLEPGFIEGVHEEASPLGGDYAYVTTTLDVSPRANFDQDLGLYPH